MSKADNEHAQKQELEPSLYEFFVSFPTPADDANCSKEFPVAERSAAQRPTPCVRKKRPPGVCWWGGGGGAASCVRTCRKFLGGYFFEFIKNRLFI